MRNALTIALTGALTGLLALALCSAAPAQDATGTVELEILLAPGVSPIEAQKWGEMLEGVPVDNLQIRSGQAGETEKLDNYGSEKRPLYKVKGILTDRGELMVPGATFRFGDKTKITEWINTLKTKGDGALFDKPKMFGLGSKQLVDLYKLLQSPVESETKGRPSKEVVLEILKRTGCKSTASAEAKKLIQVDQPVLDELKGLSAGTALAAVLRPLGLVFYPSIDKEKQTILNIVEVRETEEPWPIGWPPEKTGQRAIPKYREQITVAFDETDFAAVMDAIGGKLGVHFLFDHNSLVRNRFDIETETVTLPEEKLSYARILEKVFSPRKLTHEIRMDEAGLHFIWVRSIGKAKPKKEDDAPVLGAGIKER